MTTLAALAVLLQRRARRSDLLRSSRLLLSYGLAGAFVGDLAALAFDVVVGRPPALPWLTGGLLLRPLAVGALLAVPAAAAMRGAGIRAAGDGLVAATSLWYLLLTFGLGHSPGAHDWIAVARLSYPVTDVFVISAGLTVLARCAAPARRYVLWIVGGFCVELGNDVWRALIPISAPRHGPLLLLQLGLLVLVGAALVPPVESLLDRSPRRDSWLWMMVPLAPLGASMVMTVRMIVAGDGMSHAEVTPALLVAVALALRQFVISSERQRLVVRLRGRERSLEDALRHDHLTGLANRLGMTERLDDVLREPSCLPVAIAVLDLNNFKLINDSQGHLVGDALLRAVARRLRASVRQTDMVARLGGDEFAVIATRVSAGMCNELGERLLSCFDDPVEVASRRFQVGASVGLVVGGPPDTASELLADADAAMYEAKTGMQGKSQVRMLHASDRQRIGRYLKIKEGIASPDLSQFGVVYQPLVNLATGEIVGMETLARWHHPEVGLVPPDVFIPLAEQFGSIVAVGDHVLHTAVADLARIRPRSDGFSIGVNVSPRQLACADFAGRVLALTAAHGLDNRQIILEITEQAFEADLDPVAASVEQLVSAGVRIAVDDFGTGYSSLRYLERLPLQIMKIDRSFVAGMATSQTTRDLVAAVATMGHALGLDIVAEGVESVEDLRFLQGTACQLGQGYLFSTPIVAGEIQGLIESGHVYPVKGLPSAPTYAGGPFGGGLDRDSPEAQARELAVS